MFFLCYFSLLWVLSQYYKLGAIIICMSPIMKLKPRLNKSLIELINNGAGSHRNFFSWRCCWWPGEWEQRAQGGNWWWEAEATSVYQELGIFVRGREIDGTRSRSGAWKEDPQCWEEGARGEGKMGKAGGKWGSLQEHVLEGLPLPGSLLLLNFQGCGQQGWGSLCQEWLWQSQRWCSTLAGNVQCGAVSTSSYALCFRQSRLLLFS